MPNWASQSRVAFASRVWNTGSSSPGELLITPSTSEGPLLPLQSHALPARSSSPTSAAVTFGQLFPLRQAFGDDLRRLGCRLAHMRIFRNLPLDALAFVLQVVPQRLQLGNELVDLHHRHSGNALDE